MIKFLVDENGLEHCVNNEYKVADTIEQLAHPEVKDPAPRKSIIQRICDLFRKPQESQLDREHKIAKELTEWIASQKPLDPEDAKLLEENLWKLV